MEKKGNVNFTKGLAHRLHKVKKFQGKKVYKEMIGILPKELREDVHEAVEFLEMCNCTPQEQERV